MNKLILSSALVIMSFFGNVCAFADDGEYDAVINKINNEIQRQQKTLQILKDLVTRFEDGLIGPEDVDAYINKAKMGPEYAGIPLQTYDIFTEDGKTLSYIIPEGYTLEKPKNQAPGFEQCMRQAESRNEMGECDDAAVTYYDGKLNEIFSSAKSACNSEDCKKDLLNAQRAWIKYRESTNNFLGEHIAIFNYTASIQTDFWLDELIKQYNLLKMVGEVLDEMPANQ